MAGLLDFLQAASNAAASNVSGPVDGINWLLKKVGVPVSDAPVGGSQWMQNKGLTRPVQQGAAQVAGETVGLLSPLMAAQYAPQIAKGLLQAGENMATPATLNPQKGAIVWQSNADKFKEAQKNAETMLGLPPNNTAADRAKAMGFVDAYHGTADDIAKIDPSKFGSATGANSAKKAFWAVDDPTTARGYAEYAATDAKVKKLIDAAGKAEKRGDWNAYEKLVADAETLAAKFIQEPLQGQNIMPLKIRANRGVRGMDFDAKGAEFVDVEGGVNSLLNSAIRDKRDLVVIKNLADDVGLNGRPATHFAAMNPSVIRSRFAAFDPARANSADILASFAAAGLLSPLLFGEDR